VTFEPDQPMDAVFRGEHPLIGLAPPTNAVAPDFWTAR
jgi:hypothetical protein